MKSAISPLAYLIDDESLQIILDGLNSEEAVKLLYLGIDILGLDRDLAYQIEKDNSVKQMITHFSSCCREDNQQRSHIVKAALEYPNKVIFMESEKIDFNPQKSVVSTKKKMPTPNIRKKENNINLATLKSSQVKANEQQEEIIDNCLKGIQVDAFAGTGKSTTCKMILDKLGHDNSLYTAFLSQNIEDAKEKITRNAVTQDGLAKRFVLEHTSFKDIFIFNSRKGAPVYPMKDVLGFDMRLNIGAKVIKQYGVAKLINDTVANYCTSSEDEFFDKNVPQEVTIVQTRKKIHSWAMAYWDYLLSGKATSEHSVTFIHLMKFWSLSPHITIPDKYRNIIVDEAPCVRIVVTP